MTIIQSREERELPAVTGNAGKVLTVNSGATGVEWAARSSLPTPRPSNSALIDQDGQLMWAQVGAGEFLGDAPDPLDGHSRLGFAKPHVTFTSVTVSAWVSDNTYADYPYRASVALTGVTASDFAEVTFSAADAVSGYYAPVCETYAGGVYLYSTSDDSITVPTIAVLKG